VWRLVGQQTVNGLELLLVRGHALLHGLVRRRSFLWGSVWIVASRRKVRDGLTRRGQKLYRDRLGLGEILPHGVALVPALLLLCVVLVCRRRRRVRIGNCRRNGRIYLIRTVPSTAFITTSTGHG